MMKEKLLEKFRTFTVISMGTKVYFGTGTSESVGEHIVTVADWCCRVH